VLTITEETAWTVHVNVIPEEEFECANVESLIQEGGLCNNFVVDRVRTSEIFYDNVNTKKVLSSNYKHSFDQILPEKR
jgi:hypothetical protein